MSERDPSEAREQVLRAAERLFSERGYTAVTLKEIADLLGVRQAALYYHVPQGKEQLYVEVTARGFRRHRQGLGEVCASAPPDIRAQLIAAAEWLLSQPPLDLSRLARTDLPALSPSNAEMLYTLGRAALLEPVQGILTHAYERGEVRLVDAELLATAFLAMIDTLHTMERYKRVALSVLARDLVDVLVDGLKR